MTKPLTRAELEAFTVPVSKEAQLRAMLHEFLSRMKMTWEPKNNMYIFKMPDPLVMTDEAHSIMLELLAEADRP